MSKRIPNQTPERTERWGHRSGVGEQIDAIKMNGMAYMTFSFEIAATLAPERTDGEAKGIHSRMAEATMQTHP